MTKVYGFTYFNPENDTLVTVPGFRTKEDAEDALDDELENLPWACMITAETYEAILQ